MRIAHISDLHMCSSPDTYIYGVNPYENMMRAISLLKDRQDIELGVITGDISNDGSIDSYLIADEILSGFNFPIYIINGNHDNADELLKKPYSKMKYAPTFEFGGIHFFSLNTVALADDGTNRSRGRISETEFARLRYYISKTTGPIVVLMHHPATLTHSWLDRRILEDRERFIECVTASDKVITVLSGHNHYATKKRVKGCLFSTAPSVSTSFSVNLKPFEEANTPGISIVDIYIDSSCYAEEWPI